MRARVEQAERPAPGVADQHQLVAAEAAAQVIDHRVEVGEVPRDGELLRVGGRVEGAARAALVPVGDHEVLLEVAVEVTEQRPLGAARPAVEPEQDGRLAIGTAHLEVERRAIDREPLAGPDLCTRVRGGAARDAERKQEPGCGIPHRKVGLPITRSTR
jgi:hypothetical protein